MGTPADHLPKPISENAINSLLISVGLPKASQVLFPRVTVEYHSIYIINLPPYDRSNHSDLVSRVSGHHLPYIKTENEVDVMSWVSQHTTIPIPDIVAYDCSSNNPLAHEYTLLHRVQGATL
jgi:hypothetical protein